MRDKQKHKIAKHQHYLDNKEAYKNRLKQLRIKNRKLVYEFKLQHPCLCGESDPRCLDLHHINPKDKDRGISLAVAAFGEKRLFLELSKCKCMCANCHRKYHSQYFEITTTNKSRIKTRQMINDYKINHPCICGESDPFCLSFHHSDSNKLFCLGNAVYDHGRDLIFAEIAKCIVICENCHRKLHN